MTDPVKKLSLLVDCRVFDRTTPESLQAWLTEALERWQRGESLPDAFGIYDTASERRLRRNTALKEYASALPGGIWEKSKTIAEEIAKIRQNRKNTSPVLQRIDSVYQLPESTRQIFNILLKS